MLLQENADRLPSTIVRPSHTYRTRFPGLVVDGDHLAWRILNDKPVLVHDDGERTAIETAGHLIGVLSHFGQLESRRLHRPTDDLMIATQDDGLRVGGTNVDAGREGHDACRVGVDGARLAKM